MKNEKIKTGKGFFHRKIRYGFFLTVCMIPLLAAHQGYENYQSHGNVLPCFLTIDTPITGDVTYEACDSIHLSSVIDPSGNVIAVAGDRIRLKPGFKADNGASFHAYTNDGCDNCTDTPTNLTEGWDINSSTSLNYQVTMDHEYDPSSGTYAEQTIDNVELQIGNGNINILYHADFYGTMEMGPYPFNEYGEMATQEGVPLRITKMLHLFDSGTFQNPSSSWSNVFPSDNSLSDDLFEEQQTSYFDILGNSTNAVGDILTTIDYQSFMKNIDNSYFQSLVSQSDPLTQSQLNASLNDNIFWIGQVVWNLTQRRVESCTFDYELNPLALAGSDENIILSSDTRRHLTIELLP